MTLFYREESGNQKPSDAIEIRGDKVASFYEIVVRTWKPKSEIWALSYGPMVLGVAGSLSGIWGNMYFRKKLRLKNYGLISTYIPNSILPFLIANSIHTAVIHQDIFLDPLGCSICKETKAATIQVGIALLQPMVLVPASTFMFATRHFTYRIPSPIDNRKEFIKFLKQLFKPLKVPMTVNCIGQVLLAMFITHMEENQFLYVQKTIFEPNTTTDVESKIA